jgi:hypothetical protein
MNTKIVTQRLAMADAPLHAKEEPKALARHKAQKIGLAVAMLVASTRVFAAQEQHEHPQYGFYQNRPPCTSLDDCDHRPLINRERLAEWV